MGSEGRQDSFRKRTGFASNNDIISQELERHCKGEHDHEHIIGGQRAAKAQEYPLALREAIVRAYARSIKKELHQRTSEEIIKQDKMQDHHWATLAQLPREPWEALAIDLDPEDDEAAGEPDPDGEAAGESAGEAERGGGPHEHDPEEPGDPGEDGDRESEERASEGVVIPGQRRKNLAKLIQRAHEGLGHPHRERFLRILRYSKASDEVMAIARRLHCSACERNKEVRPARKSAPPRELGINEMVGADLVWLTRHDTTGSGNLL